MRVAFFVRASEEELKAANDDDGMTGNRDEHIRETLFGEACRLGRHVRRRRFRLRFELLWPACRRLYLRARYWQATDQSRG